MTQPNQSIDNQPGNYSDSFITDICADLNSEKAVFFRKTLHKYPSEAMYIYSFVENRMIYAQGWEKITGYKDEEINMVGLIKLTAPEFLPFVHEVNDKALMFIHQQTEELLKYSFTLEKQLIHKNESRVPVRANVRVFDVDDKGNVLSIMGKFEKDTSLRFGKVMRFSAYGPEKHEFEKELNELLFHKNVISDKEKEAVELVSKGFALKEIADILKISKSAVEKRILPLYKRFNLKSLSHLVSFAYENHILP